MKRGKTAAWSVDRCGRRERRSSLAAKGKTDVLPVSNSDRMGQ